MLYNYKNTIKEWLYMPISSAFIMPHPPLIIPEVGRGEEAKVQKTIDSFHMAAKQIAQMRPETIILISPHSVLYADYIHISPGKKASGSLKRFGAPAVFTAKYDEELADEICRICESADFPAGTLGEKSSELDHGTLVPLYFVNQYYTGYKLIRCSVSGLTRQEHYKFGVILQDAANSLDRNTVLIASGDLSHRLEHDGPYGFAPEGPELDKTLVDIMKSGDFGKFLEVDENLSEKGADCGLNSFIIMAGALDKKAVDTKFYSYEGPLGVGYAVCAYKVAGDDITRDFAAQYAAESQEHIQTIRNNESVYVKLARETLEYYVAKNKIPPFPDNLPDELANTRAGVFVSIKKNGQLRGCIGTTEPTRANVAEEIRQNAVSSGTRDPRFSPVAKDELGELIYNVDVLSPAEACKKEDLDVKRYGVIVTNGYKRGLLLPDLDGVDSVDEQINIACRKAGITPREKYTLERFEVRRNT